VENKEIIENTQEVQIENNEHEEPTKRKYMIVCAKLGLSMCIYFICRFLAGISGTFLVKVLSGVNHNLFTFINFAILTLFVYVIPIVFTALIFKYNVPLGTLYKKPKRLARALGTFPATFGFGYGIALLTLLVSYILSRIFGGETFIEQLLRPTTVEATTSISQIIMLVLLMVVAAPLFEEYWVRGIMFDALKPYGTGMAIIISSILFGIMHGSLYMLFYTTAYGFALGYIRYATGSLFIVTILHAIVNSVAATTLLLLSLVDITESQNKVINTIYEIYVVAVVIMIIISVIVFLAKIPAIRRYKFENPWNEIGPWKKFGIFIISVPVIIMLLLAANEITGHRFFMLFY